MSNNNLYASHSIRNTLNLLIKHSEEFNDKTDLKKAKTRIINDFNLMKLMCEELITILNYMGDSASMEDLSKTDYKVFLALLSQLSGFSARKTNGLAKDPANFTNISISAISSKIDVKKSKVLDSVNKLEDLGIIEVGNGDTVRNGYRFTF